jgi:hypothetical protein
LADNKSGPEPCWRCRRLFICGSYKLLDRLTPHINRELEMSGEHPELDTLQAAYKNAVEAWIVAIRKEEALASVNHEIAEVDQWEAAHFEEDDIRSKVKAAKEKYEDALREKFFGF